jgi:hypothetical protein
MKLYSDEKQIAYLLPNELGHRHHTLNIFCYWQNHKIILMGNIYLSGAK